MTWRTSSYSADSGTCAEAGQVPHGVAVRDTKDRGGPVLVFGPAAWRGFARAVRRGELPAGRLDP